MGSHNRGGRKLKRAYVRKHTNNAPGIVAPTSPPQIAELAFNIHGWALEDGMTWRATYEVINAYNATMVKGGFEAKIADLVKEKQGQVYRDDLQYTQRELDPNLAKTDPAVSQYLVIGYTLQEDDPIYKDNKTFARYSENELVGEALPSPHNLIQWTQVRTPILVVTPVKENTGTSVRLFGLVMPRSGLCQPVLLTHERIFYRWEFRASAGARSSQRNKNWNQVVIDKARALTPAEALLAADDGEPVQDRLAKRRRCSDVGIKHEAEWTNLPGALHLETAPVFELELFLPELFEPAAEQVHRLTIGPQVTDMLTRVKMALNPENRGILNAIQVSKSARVHQQIQASLMQIAQASKRPSAQSGVVSYFENMHATMHMEDAEMISEELKMLWPHLAHVVDPHALWRIRQVMQGNGQAIAATQMEDFFRILLATLRTFPAMSNDELGRCIADAAQTSLILGGGQFVVHDDGNIGMDAVFLVTLLKELLVIHDWQSTSLLGVPARNLPGSFAGIYLEHWLELPSVEGGASALRDMLDGVFAKATAKGHGVEDILLWLDRLRIRIQHARSYES